MCLLFFSLLVLSVVSLKQKIKNSDTETYRRVLASCLFVMVAHPLTTNLNSKPFSLFQSLSYLLTWEHEWDVCICDRSCVCICDLVWVCVIVCAYMWSCVCICDLVCVCVIVCAYVWSLDALACVARILLPTLSKSPTDSLCFLFLFPSFLYLFGSIAESILSYLSMSELVPPLDVQHPLTLLERRMYGPLTLYCCMAHWR